MTPESLGEFENLLFLVIYHRSYNNFIFANTNNEQIINFVIYLDKINYESPNETHVLKKNSRMKRHIVTYKTIRCILSAISALEIFDIY